MTLAVNGASKFEGPLNDGSLDVNIQDVTSPPLVDFFSESVSSFTLASDTVASTDTTLVYDFTATGGHGLVVDDEVILLDIVGNRGLIGIVKGVSVDVITLDRPIDHVFPIATSLCRKVNSNMAVDGSVTPRIFTMRAGSVPADIVNIIFTLTDATQGGYDDFGGISDGLDNGVVIRIVDGYQQTVFNFKTNGSFMSFGGDYQTFEKVGGGEYGYVAHFHIREHLGTVFRVDNDSILQVIIQDDLTGLEVFKATALGQETVGEE